MKRYSMSIKVFQIIKHDTRKSFKPLPKSVGSTWHREAVKRGQLRAARRLYEKSPFYSQQLILLPIFHSECPQKLIQNACCMPTTKQIVPLRGSEHPYGSPYLASVRYWRQTSTPQLLELRLKLLRSLLRCSIFSLLIIFISYFLFTLTPL